MITQWCISFFFFFFFQSNWNTDHPKSQRCQRWRGTTAGHRQSRRFLAYTDDNWLLQVIEEPTRRGAVLDFALTNKEGLVNMKLKSSLGCSGHEVADFKVLGAVRSVGRRSLPWTKRGQTSASSRIFLAECHGIRPWREEWPKRAGWYWRVVSFRFKCNASLQRGNHERKPRGLHGWTWMSSLENPKQVAYRGCKQGKVAWEEYTEIVQGTREMVRKVKYWQNKSGKGHQG